MGQKTNPISLRLQNVNRNFDSVWYSDHFYAKCFSREFFLTNYYNTFLKLVKLPQARISVNFGIQNIKLYPFFCIPKASRVSLAKNLGLFQHLSKAWSNLPQSFVSSKSKNFGLGRFGNNQQNKLFANNLNDNLFFRTTPKNKKMAQPSLFHETGTFNEINKKTHNNNTNPHKSSLVNKQNSDIFDVSAIQNFDNKHRKHNTNFYFLENISAKLLLNSPVSDLDWSKQTSRTQDHLETNTSKRNLKTLLLQYYRVAARFEYNKNFSHQLENSGNIELARISSNLFFHQTFGIDPFQNKDINSFYLLNDRDSIPYSLSKSSRQKGKFNKIKSLNTNIVEQNTSLSFLPTLEQDNFGTDQKLYNKLCLLNHSPNEKINIGNSLYNTLGDTKSMISQKKFKYKNHIENFLSRHYNIDLQLFPFCSKQNWQSAGFIADEIVYFIERRVSFSRIKNRILRQASMQSFIRGIRITCNGRVGGKSKKAQRATQECVKYGETSLHVFECKIDFASRSANTSFGLVGIKVWICFK